MSKLTAEKPFKYYEISAVYEGEREQLFSSYDKSECRYELEAERDYWRGCGYKKIMLRCTDTDIGPDPEIYEEIEQPILVSGSGRSEAKLERGEISGSRFAFYKDGEQVFSLYAGSTNTARLLAHWNNHVADEQADYEPEVIVLRGFDK